jgi:hypothetical protein
VLGRQSSKGVPIPIGLATLVRRHLHGLAYDTTKQAMHARMAADREFWTRRPVPADVCAYSAADVLLLLPLHAKLDACLSSADRRFVARCSDAYLGQVRDSADGRRAAGSVGDDVPLYGIREFDLDVERLVGNLKKRGLWKRSQPKPTTTTTTTQTTDKGKESKC